MSSLMEAADFDIGQLEVKLTGEDGEAIPVAINRDENKPRQVNVLFKPQKEGTLTSNIEYGGKPLLSQQLRVNKTGLLLLLFYFIFIIIIIIIMTIIIFWLCW